MHCFDNMGVEITYVNSSQVSILLQNHQWFSHFEGFQHPQHNQHPRSRLLRQAKEHFAESGRLRNWIWQSDSLERYKCDVFFCFYGKHLLYSKGKTNGLPRKSEKWVTPRSLIHHIEIWLVKTLSGSQWTKQLLGSWTESKVAMLYMFFLWLFMVQSSEPNIVAWDV